MEAFATAHHAIGGHRLGDHVEYRVTVRYGTDRQNYHLATVDASDLPTAMRAAAEEMPPEVAEAGNLVEIRPAIDADDRSYLE